MLYYAVCRSVGPIARCVVHGENGRLHIYTNAGRARKVAKSLAKIYARTTYEVLDISSTHTRVAPEDPTHDPKFNKFGEELKSDEEEEEEEENTRVESTCTKSKSESEEDDEEEGAYVEKSRKEKKGASRAKLLSMLRGKIQSTKR